jgi:hypothetical protein
MATKHERFPKRFFKADDLKGRPVVVEIKEEKLEEIKDPKTGKTVKKSVLSFVNTEQKLVLNAANFDLICEIIELSDSSEFAAGRNSVLVQAGLGHSPSAEARPG